jgi:hypothetical protein
MANQLQTTCDNLRSFVATGSLGRERSPAPPAFVGCISGLGGAGRQALLYLHRAADLLKREVEDHVILRMRIRPGHDIP